MANEPLFDSSDDDEAIVAEAEKVVRVARVLREVDWPGYGDDDDDE